MIEEVVAHGFDHLARLSDHNGLFEHADGTLRREEDVLVTVAHGLTNSEIANYGYDSAGRISSVSQYLWALDPSTGFATPFVGFDPASAFSCLFKVLYTIL